MVDKSLEDGVCVAFRWLFRGLFVAVICLEKQCLGVFRGFPCFFRGPRFGQILRVLALEKSSERKLGGFRCG